MDHYAINELIPFAVGNFYILSFDVARWIISSTYKRGLHYSVSQDTFPAVSLQPLGTLEDISMALWLLATQIHPVNIPSVYSSVQDAHVTFIAVAGLREPSLFEDVHDIGSSSRLQKKNLTDSENVLKPQLKVFVTSSAVYAIFLVDKILYGIYPNITLKYVTDSIENLKEPIDVLVVSPNDFGDDSVTGADDRFDKWNIERQRIFREKMAGTVYRDVIMISGEALDLSILHIGIENLRMLVTTTTAKSHNPIRIDANVDICEQEDCWPKIWGSTPVVLYIPVAASAFSEMIWTGSSRRVRELLMPRNLTWAKSTLARKVRGNDIAYLYTKCRGGDAYNGLIDDAFQVPMRDLRVN